METVKIEVPFIYVHYMNKVDQDGNNYRFFGDGKVWSNIDYFCTEEAGNLLFYNGDIRYEIVPKEIRKIPESSYRKLCGEYNKLTCGKKPLYMWKNHILHSPDKAIIKKAGHDINGNSLKKIMLFKGTRNVTSYFKIWRTVNGTMTTNDYEVERMLKNWFGNIEIIVI